MATRSPAIRAHVDAAVERLIETVPAAEAGRVFEILEIGLHHEQQHQELILTDILHAFAQNPTDPVYDPAWQWPRRRTGSARLCRSCPQASTQSATTGEGYCFDNELPRHDELIPPVRIARHLVTNAEWLEFIADWRLHDAFALAVGRLGRGAGRGLAGARLLAADRRRLAHDDARRLAAGRSSRAGLHVSYYEAEAFARFAGKHLPSEAEWEVAARAGLLADAFGGAWQWTRSAYLPYPGYRAAEGALGEYNGKFMVNQMVLRGASLATPEGHERVSYRNFFYPPARWQFSGLRLVEFDLSMVAVARRAQSRASLRPSRSTSSKAWARRPSAFQPKYFYDAAGSQLFERITELPEYYPTRSEMQILQDHASAIAGLIPEGAHWSNSAAARARRRAFCSVLRRNSRCYVPVDICGEMIEQEAAELRPDFPGLKVLPVVADICFPFELPAAAKVAPVRVGFFPGSTIGNFEPHEAAAFLRNAAHILGAGATLIVGADLIKDAEILNAAYNDAAGVTAAFNLNLLRAYQSRARRHFRSRYLRASRLLQPRAQPHRDAPRQPQAAEGEGRRQDRRIPRRRNHPHREQLQIQPRVADRFGARCRLAAGRHVDRPAPVFLDPGIYAGRVTSSCQSGTSRRRGPGIHTPQRWGYGFRARGFQLRPGMTK